MSDLLSDAWVVLADLGLCPDLAARAPQLHELQPHHAETVYAAVDAEERGLTQWTTHQISPEATEAFLRLAADEDVRYRLFYGDRYYDLRSVSGAMMTIMVMTARAGARRKKASR